MKSGLLVVAVVSLLAALWTAGEDAAVSLGLSRLFLAAVALRVALALWQRRGSLAPSLRAYFYHRDEAANLAWTRIVVFALIAWRIHPDTDIAAATLPASLIQAPIGMDWLVPWMPTDADFLAQLATVVRVASVAAALGVATRLSTTVASLTCFTLLFCGYMYGAVGHDRHHFVWFSVLLAASRSGDALSIDALWRNRCFGQPRDAPVRAAPSTEYGFPRRTIFALFGVLYFFAGFWKLAVVGVDWFAGDNLHLLALKLHLVVNSGLPMIVELAPWLVAAGGAYTVLFELGFVFALFHPTTRALAAVAGVVFHAGVGATVGLGFENLAYCYLVFLNPVALVRAGLACVPSVRRTRFGGELVRRFARPAADDDRERPGRRPSAVLVATAATLLIGNIAFGCAAVVESFPLACFPTFATRQEPLVSAYVVEGRRDGARVEIRNAEMGEPHIGRRLHGMLRGTREHIAGLEQIDDRQPRWRALCTYVWANHPALVGARDVTLVLEDFRLSVETGEATRIARRVVFPCDAPAPAP